MPAGVTRGGLLSVRSTVLRYVLFYVCYASNGTLRACFFYHELHFRQMSYSSLTIPLTYLRSCSLPALFALLSPKLRDSNVELKAEVLALRTYMLQRGVTPVEDFFADPSPEPSAVLLSPTVSPPPQTPAENRSPSQPTPNTPPPPVLPREARLAALALLWAAAVSVGGVFVPIAIREGATSSLRWLDDGGTLIPAPVRRVLGGYRGRWRGKGWGSAVLSYIPVLARAPKSAGEGGHGEEGGELQGERLAGAWDELKPRKRRRAP